MKSTAENLYFIKSMRTANATGTSRKQTGDFFTSSFFNYIHKKASTNTTINENTCHKTRQLAAIMFTDIVGYTALMGLINEKDDTNSR
jgi:hypothetical protein